MLVTGLVTLDARVGGPGQCADLHAGVVVIELAGDRLALGLEQVAQGITQRALTAVTHVQRAGGVGRDELDQHVAAVGGLPAELVAFSQHIGDDGLLSLGLEAQVDETGASDLDGELHPLLDSRLSFQRNDQGGGQLAGVLFEGLGQLHGRGHGQVAVGSLLGGLENRCERRRGVGRHLAQGFTQGRKKGTLGLDHGSILRG